MAYTVGVLINTASGSADDTTDDKVRAVLAQLGIQPKVWCVDGEGLDRAIEETQTAGLDVLVVFGGDGTIRATAKAARADGPALIPLPGGTMNLLPKALYGDRAWEEVLLDTFRCPKERVISGGKIGKDRFFIAAILGAPTLWAGAREALREGDVFEAVGEGAHALKHMFASKVRYSFNEMHEGEAEVVWITCPLIASTLADERQVLEASIIDAPSAGELLEIATAAALGQWRDARNVAVVTTKKVTISADGDIPIMLDGETETAEGSAEVEFVPDAFHVLVPNATRVKYFIDFDRTIFDTPSFKKSITKRPSLFKVLGQLKDAAGEWLNPEGTGSRFERFRRSWGTFLSHGRFAFTPEELKQFIYPEIPAFLKANDCTIVTYGVESFIRAKVTSALTDLPVSQVVYTSRHKGRTIERLTKGKEGPFCFIDDAHFQLESVARHCPNIQILEIRRDSQEGHGRWPVIHSFDEIPMVHSPNSSPQ